MAARAPNPLFNALRRRANKREARTFVDMLVGMLSDPALQDEVERRLGSISTKYRRQIADRLMMLACAMVPDHAAWAAILVEHLSDVPRYDRAAWDTVVVEHVDRARERMREHAPGEPHLRVVVVAEQGKPASEKKDAQ